MSTAPCYEKVIGDLNTNPRSRSLEELRELRLEALLAAALDHEAAPNFVHLEQLVLASARAWAKAERELVAREGRAAP